MAREARKRGIRIFDNDKVNKAFGRKPGKKASGYIQTFDDYARKSIADPEEMLLYNRNARKVAGHIGKSGKVINIAGKYDKSFDTIAHEIGHDMNNDGKISKIIKRINARAKNPKKYEHNIHKSGIKNEVGSLMNSAKNKISKLLENPTEYLEERNAWNNAEKLLKRNGATKEQIEQLRQNKKAALETYKSGQKAGILRNLRNKIQIESNQYGVGGLPATSKKIKQQVRARSKMRKRREQE